MIPENRSVTDQVKDFVFLLFKNKLGGHYVYHNLKHTEEVTDAVKRIAGKMNLSDEDSEIVTLAALLHDTGFTVRSANHEDASIEIAENFLKEINYPAEKIEKITGCINATRLPQSPNNVLEEIIADADLYHLGTKDYQLKSDLLRTEWELENNNQFTDLEWLKINIDFLSSHKYFTKYAKKYLDEYKSELLIKLQKDFRKKSDKLNKTEKQKNELTSSEKVVLNVNSEIIDSKAYSENIIDKTISTKLKLISFAEIKANAMLYLNVLIVALVLILPSTDTLNFPLLIIFFTSFICILFSIPILFPDKSEKLNERIEMQNDRITDSNTIFNEYYELNKIQLKKNKYLRICYMIFLSGLIISVAAYFVISKISLDKL